jgi:hypothetical protein
LPAWLDFFAPAKKNNFLKLEEAIIKKSKTILWQRSKN